MPLPSASPSGSDYNNHNNDNNNANNNENNDNNDDDAVYDSDVSLFRATKHARLRELKRELRCKLFRTLDQLDLNYDTHYWAFAKNELDNLKKLLDTVHNIMDEIMLIMNELERDFIRFLNSIHRQIKARLPKSRREQMKFTFLTLQEWYKSMDDYISNEYKFITEKKTAVECAYIRPIKRKSLYEVFQQYEKDCFDAGFDLKVLQSFIEQNIRPMAYTLMLNIDSISEINHQIFLLNEIENMSKNAPDSLKTDLPHILSDFLPDEALFKLRNHLNINSVKKYSPIVPKELLTFEILRNFLVSDKSSIPARVFSDCVQVNKDLEKYAGNKILARKRATINAEEANRLLQSGKITSSQLFPLVAPFDPSEPYQDFEIKQFLLLTEDEMCVQARSTLETDQLDNYELNENDDDYRDDADGDLYAHDDIDGNGDGANIGNTNTGNQDFDWGQFQQF